MDTTPDQITRTVGAGAAPRSSHVNTSFLSTQSSPDTQWILTQFFVPLLEFFTNYSKFPTDSIFK